MKKILYLSSLYILTSLFFTNCSTDKPVTPDSVAPPVFESLSDIPAVMEHKDIPGVSIAIIDDFKIDTLMAFGVSDKETMEPITTQTVFHAASITKSFTSVLALGYVEEGILSLDDDFNNYLVSWKIPENELTVAHKVTLRGLLSHMSGMSVDNGNGFDPRYSIPTLLNILNGELPATTDPVSVLTVPGTNYNYSNIGYGIIQLGLTDILGKPFPELMDENILHPLGMTNSLIFVGHPPNTQYRCATGYWGDGTKVSGGGYIYPVMGPSGLWSTPEDLARFAIEIQKTIPGSSNLLISQENAKMMIEPVHQFSNITGYALGYSTHLVSGEKYFAHGGHTKGFRSRFYAHESSGDGLVVMMNSDEEGDFIDRLIEIVGEIYDWPG